jgi:ketosteroid isomerase-like protein
MNNHEVVRRYFRCLDEEDWETMGTLWHEDSELMATGARPRRGREEVLGYFSKLFVPWPAHADTPTRMIESGSTIVAEVTFTGRTADGREVSFDAVDIFDCEDGRIRRMTNWYDVAYARRLLAESPSPA